MEAPTTGTTFTPTNEGENILPTITIANTFSMKTSLHVCVTNHYGETGNGATDSPNLNDTGSQNDPTRVIVGVVIGVLVILVLGVAIMMAIFFLVRHGKTKSKSKRTTANGLGKHPPF